MGRFAVTQEHPQGIQTRLDRKKDENAQKGPLIIDLQSGQKDKGFGRLANAREQGAIIFNIGRQPGP